MINLVDVVKKLEKVLNGKDTEIELSPINEKYDFRCYSEGIYLSTIGGTNKNFIPVIIGALGGNYNPIPDMEQADYSIQVQMFYPVRFKDDFYALNEFLVKTFVGKTLQYGNQYALSNISVAQYGELQNIDFNEFAKWIKNAYSEKIDVMETYMSMSFTLFLSTAKNLNQENGLIYGNEWKTDIKIGYLLETHRTLLLDEQEITPSGDTITFDYVGAVAKVIDVTMEVDGALIDCSWSNPEQEGENLSIDLEYEQFQTQNKVKITLYYKKVVEEFSDNAPFYITQTDISSSEPIAQQILGEKVSLGKSVQTSYTKEIPLYIKNNSKYRNLIDMYLQRQLQGKIVLIAEKCETLGVQNQRLYFITNMSFVKTKGQLLGISLTLAEDLEND